MATLAFTERCEPHINMYNFSINTNASFLQTFVPKTLYDVTHMDEMDNRHKRAVDC